MDKSLVVKPLLSQVAELLNAVSGFAWPLLIIALLFLLRHQLTEIIAAAVEKLQRSSEIEFGSLKLKGAIVTQSGDVLRNETASLKIVPAPRPRLPSRYNKCCRPRERLGPWTRHRSSSRVGFDS